MKPLRAADKRREYEARMLKLAGIDFAIETKEDLKRAQKICVGKIVEATRAKDQKLVTELGEAKEYLRTEWFRGRCRECGVKIGRKATHCSTHRNPNAVKSLPLPAGFKPQKQKGGRAKAGIPPSASGLSTHDEIRFPDGPAWIAQLDANIDRIPLYRELEKVLKRNVAAYYQFKYNQPLPDDIAKQGAAQCRIMQMIDAAVDPEKISGSAFESIYKVSPALALNLLASLRRVAIKKPNEFQKALRAIRLGEGRASAAARKRAHSHLAAINKKMFGEPPKVIVAYPNGAEYLKK